jgi:hypothetical protein
MRSRNNVAVVALPQRADDCGANQAVMARYVNTFLQVILYRLHGAL